ncbi:MAG: ferrochelatase [Nitrospirota bacterium]
MTDGGKTGVLLMTMGDAPDIESIFPYMFRLFSDPLILRAPGPIRYPLAWYISLKKLASVKERYEAIGGGSPMNSITDKQAEILEARLNSIGSRGFKVLPFGMLSTNL